MIYTDENYIKQTLIPRSFDAHKGNFGKILIFAGSVGMAGAAILCGRAALKTGAGLVQYLLPSFDSPLLNILQISVPEATCLEMKEDFDLSGYNTCIAGSGLGKSKEAKRILTYIMDNFKGTLVLDADALNMLSESSVLQSHAERSKADLIITPHVGEARRLLHTCEGVSGMESRKWAACSMAKEYNAIAILKGAGTLVAVQNNRARANNNTLTENQALAGDNTLTNTHTIAERVPEFSIYQNTTGNPGMATAGSGDSLAGIIGSLAAQGYAPLDAARMGVYIHGLSGDLAAADLGEPSVTASDIVSYIPAALKPLYVQTHDIS